MQERFNSTVLQNITQKYLQLLRLTSTVEKYSCSVSKDLEKIRGTIAKYIPEAPSQYRSSQRKVEYLNDAVIDVDWA